MPAESSKFNKVARGDARRIWITCDQGGGGRTEQVLMGVDDRRLGRLRRWKDRQNHKDCAEDESHLISSYHKDQRYA
jgi:hypothetical protein